MASSPLFPRTAEEFLAELDRRFPEPRPRADETHAEVMYRAGARSVVQIMRDAFNAARRSNTTEGVPRL